MLLLSITEIYDCNTIAAASSKIVNFKSKSSTDVRIKGVAKGWYGDIYTYDI